jgi:hypothetical protein
VHHPRTRHHANRRSRCTSAPVVLAPDDCSDQPEWADAVAHLLLPGEVAHIKAEALGWRWEPAEVTYDRNVLLFGGPVGLAVTGIVSTVANRRARRRAERAAAPAWRPLGQLVVIATDQRLLVWHQGAWWSVWYSAMTAIRLGGGPDEVELHFAADPPYRLRLSCPGTAELGRVVEAAIGPLSPSV